MDEVQKLINQVPDIPTRNQLLKNWEAVGEDSKKALTLLSDLQQALWDLLTQPENGPDHPWHYHSSIARTAWRILQSLTSWSNYAITINIPEIHGIDHEDLMEDWEESGLKKAINLFITLGYNWDYYAFLQDSGDDDGGYFGTVYLILRNNHPYDLMLKAGDDPDAENGVWFPKGLLGIPWMYANAPDNIASITQHVM